MWHVFNKSDYPSLEVRIILFYMDMTLALMLYTEFVLCKFISFLTKCPEYEVRLIYKDHIMRQELTRGHVIFP